jgi:transcriptional regulator with XRE-family HTH domain
MFNSVLYVRSVCEQKNVAISKLERECGFSNGYLNPKKMSKISYEKAVKIAEYLDISISSIMDGPNNEKNSPGKPEPTERELKILEALRSKTPDEQRALLTLLGISED